MVIQENIETLIQANFPASQEGNVSDVYYKIQEVSDTGSDISILVARTNSGVIDLGKGAYGVEYTFNKGRYSIEWDINGTPYVANEEINVTDNITEGLSSLSDQISTIDDFWTGYGGGSRDGITIPDTVSLTFQTVKNGTNTEPYSFDKIEIYNTHADAVAETNIVETITSFSSNGSGLLSYTTSTISSSGTKFDKVFFTDVDGGDQYSFISPFYMITASVTMPSSHETVRIYANLYDILDNVIADQKVRVKLNTYYARYGTEIIKQETETYTSDSNGQVIMDLIETETMTEDTYTETGDDRQIYYILTIGSKYTLKFRVPRGTGTANILDRTKLPEV
jgi:hypothetical protein